jgi:hypothetical protein
MAVIQSLQALYISSYSTRLDLSQGFDNSLSSYNSANLIRYLEKASISSSALIHAALTLSHSIYFKAHRVERFSPFVISCDGLSLTICETIDFIVGGQHHLLTHLSKHLRPTDYLPTSKNGQKKNSPPCILCH